MPSFLSFLALLSACYTLLTFASPLEARQAVVPIVTVQTVTVTPSPSNAVTSSTTTKPTTAITGSVEPMSGPGASSNGQTGTGAGADASTYTTLDGAGNTFVEVYPSSMVTITASVSTTASTTSTTSSSSTPPPSSSAAAASAPLTSSSKAFAVPTALPGQLLGVAGLGAGLLALL
ncbi:hypothetical protein B0A54_08978 [Friedmanniomyces endolithicus]|uniref:Uncharacterized protein n=1 Tax=Friedmanniomyces endolithicus TaxID=329885 RepID=A0A4U0UWJ0_9PEZI|nr:hypothetical protein B0A54_08978 [Friedmanniomyces endolithicus]